ncbi:MAG: MBL fold metallo-hydrolase, partial [Gammaproteobacteria bacterium]
MAFVFVAGMTACDQAEPTPMPEALVKTGARAAIESHSAEFERGVRQVTGNVYQAVGFGLANSMLVVGDECAFVIDVMGSVEVAGEVQA